MVNKVEKLPESLRKALKAYGRLAIAFSGGLDSRFLCHAARLCGCQVLAIHAMGPHIPARDSQFAIDWASQNEIPLSVFDYDPLNLPEVATNSPMRCYACKKDLLAKIVQIARDGGMADCPLCDGSHLDDQKGYRPGRKALEEANIISPLAEAGLGKDQIRAIGQETGLDFCGQKARPCLLTRLAYGMKPDRSQLAAVEACETELQHIFDKAPYAAGDFRLRLTPAPVLQVTGHEMALVPELREILSAHGFADAVIRVTNRISGYFDQPHSDMLQ